jgi:hypothetical protein
LVEDISEVAVMAFAVQRKHLVGVLTHGYQLPEIKIGTHRARVSHE